MTGPSADRYLDGFAPGVERWLGRLGSVRNVVRQELAARYLAAHLPAPHLPGAPLRVLDAGCGQGSQALRLAVAGHDVTGLDPDPTMLAAFDAELADPALRARVRLVQGGVEDIPALFPPSCFDLALCHGVVMYLADPDAAVAPLAAVLRHGGVLSLLARNQAGIAVRAGHRGKWEEAYAALTGGDAYVNELGVRARGDSVEALHDCLRRHGLEPVTWYGIRALSDIATLDAKAPGPDLAALLAADELAGRTDPYRAVAPLVQVIARRR